MIAESLDIKSKLEQNYTSMRVTEDFLKKENERMKTICSSLMTDARLNNASFRDELDEIKSFMNNFTQENSFHADTINKLNHLA